MTKVENCVFKNTAKKIKMWERITSIIAFVLIYIVSLGTAFYVSFKTFEAAQLSYPDHIAFAIFSTVIVFYCIQLPFTILASYLAYDKEMQRKYKSLWRFYFSSEANEY